MQDNNRVNQLGIAGKGRLTMLEKRRQAISSREIAVELYDKWVRERQKRPDAVCSENEKEIPELVRSNFSKRFAQSRKEHLKELSGFIREMKTADIVSLLVKLELPELEVSTLLHRLTAQLAADPNAKYFSYINQVFSCGCGCG